jgi:hypothetical protein
MSDSLYYTYIVDKPNSEAFFVPNGFEANVEVHLWGAGGGAGSGAAGGGGGYVKSIVTVAEGDFFEITVGGKGGDSSGGTPGTGGSGAGLNSVSFAYGFGGGAGNYQGDPEDGDAGPSGGGGGATVVIINGSVVACAGGGAGGGGYGDDGEGGATAGSPGGDTTQASLSTTTSGIPGNQGGAGASGGGGGGYPYGGGTGVVYGDDGPGGGGGYGGQSLGDLSIPGSDTTAGGRTTLYAPTSPPYGNAGYDGYAVLIFKRKYRILYKQAGAWKSVDKVWYKTPVAGTLSNVNVQTFSTVGDNAFVVPYLVKNLTVSYPTPTGMATKLFPVTAGETVHINIGDFGVATTLTGSAGTLTLPAFDTPVFNYNGNVDHIIAQDVSVATDTGASLTTSGSNASITAAAAAAGITYNVTYEGWHGDLGATISFTPVKKSVCFNNLQVYVASGSGRQFPSAHTYQQQPTVANNYIMNDYQGDYYGGEGYYTWTTNLQQQGYVSISYDQAYTPGTWVPIQNVYYKDGDWKPLINNVDLKSLVAKTLIYKGLTTETFTIPAGTTKVYARLIGGGGGGGGSYSTAAVRGLPGHIIQGNITVTAGDVLTISVGGGGAGGEDYVPPAPAGGGGGCKIICTKLHELGYLPDNIYAADELFGQWLRANDPYAYYGYVKWASVVVDWMENEGPQCMFWIRDQNKRGQAQRELAIKWARRIATPWAEHMAYKMGVGETDNRAGRMIMTTGMWISRLIGKYTKTTEPSKSIALGYVMWATFGVFWLLAGIK